MRNLNFADRLISTLDQALRTSFVSADMGAATPADDLPEGELIPEDQQDAAGLMRINHAGEVCAQALYLGQAETASAPAIRHHLQQAAADERRHLTWCAVRLSELNSHPSRLNLFWYLGSYALGAGAGLLGDKWSLGFVVETERQVEAHLEQHLSRLPPGDERSRRILQEMMADEARHGADAAAAGGRELPAPIRRLMAAAAGVMKTLAYRI